MQRRQESRRPAMLGRLIVVSVVLGIAAVGLMTAWNRLHARKPVRERYPFVEVRRAVLEPTLKAGGQLESARRTVVECQLEAITAGVQGERMTAGGASVLLKLIPEGTQVKKGDVLAVLDASEYVELLRVQRINVQRAEADKIQADLDHEIARLAMVEYRDGTLKELMQDYQQRVTLARANLEQARDRLDWTHRMKDKGYVSTSTVRTDEFTAAQLEETLRREEGEFEVFRKYSAQRTLRELEGDILGTKATLDYQTLRVQRHRDRLARLERQVDLCTIRAPHDGYVVYANNARREIFVEEGMPVRQGQDLFYLPDLNQMEVLAMINESVVRQVRVGMPARIRVEGLGDRVIPGEVAKVAQIAVSNWRVDAQYYETLVKLKGSEPGLRPGMTAQVELELGRSEDVLAVPSEAITSEGGREVCVVLRGEGLERRPVRVGRVTQELTEVTDGLREGEQVVFQPHLEEIEADDAWDPEQVATSEDQPSGGGPAPGEVAALH